MVATSRQDTPSTAVIQRPLTLLLTLALGFNALFLAMGQWQLASTEPLLIESTPAQLGLWLAGQTAKADAVSPLVRLTKLTVANGLLSEAQALNRAQAFLVGVSLLTAVSAALTLYALWQNRPSRTTAVWLLLGYMALLLNVPAMVERPLYPLILAGIVICLLLLYLAPGHFPPAYGFIVIISSILVSWELYKWLGLATGNRLPLTQFPWKLPHWQDIAEQMLQPARRNGPYLLIRILADAAFITWQEAFVGFCAGSLLGFALGIVFAHSAWLERGLMPYLVASQTVPILAIAPMIVSFLGQGWVPVAVVSAYLTFFPVTINTLRGLLSPPRPKVELLHSYAASPSTILWKLRVPSALPYLFTALKVSATGSIVGAIVGELPSSRSDGLAAAILRASGNYAAEPEKLWAAIIVASLLGMIFYGFIALAEQWVVRQK